MNIWAASGIDGSPCNLQLQVARYRYVDDIAGKVERLGGTIIKGPFATFYGQWQVRAPTSTKSPPTTAQFMWRFLLIVPRCSQLVLADPEGHVVRIASMGDLPDGVEASEPPPVRFETYCSTDFRLVFG